MYIYIVILIILIYFYNPHISDVEKYLQGSWRCDSQFCGAADIDDMTLYIGPDTAGTTRWLTGGHTRKCHLLMEPDVTSQVIELNYRGANPGRWTIGKYRIKPTITWTEREIWPEDAVWEFDIYKGMLRIYDSDDKLWAVLFKNHELTSLAEDSLTDSNNEPADE